MIQFFLGLFVGGFLMWLACFAYADKISKAIVKIANDHRKKPTDEADWWKPADDDEYWKES